MSVSRPSLVTKTSLSPPFTVYAVALLYASGGRGVQLLANVLVSVAGIQPLADDEATARGQALLIENWDEARYGPPDDWHMTTSTVSRFCHHHD